MFMFNSFPNKAIALDEKVQSSMSDIKVQEKARYDTVGNDSKHTQSITFLGESFSYDRFDFSSHHIDTVSAGYHLRHVYYGVSSKMKGTIFTKLKDGTISENSKFNERALKDTVDSYMTDINTINIIFWIVWFIVTALIIFAFYYIDNRWLE